MKFTLLISLCLVVCAFADVEIGEPAEGDIVVDSKHIVRPGHPIIPTVAIVGLGSPTAISAVRAVNAEGSNAVVKILKGGPGQHHVVVAAASKPGEGIDVVVEAYGPPPPPPPPPSTEPPATEPSSPPSSEVPTSSPAPPPTAEPSSPNPEN